MKQYLDLMRHVRENGTYKEYSHLGLAELYANYLVDEAKAEEHYLKTIELDDEKELA